MEGSENVYFTAEKPTIYPKSLGIYLKSCDYLPHFSMIKDEDYRSTGYFMNF